MLDVVWYSLEDAQMFLSKSWNLEYNIRCFHIRGLGPDPSTINPVYTPGQLKKVVFVYGSMSGMPCVDDASECLFFFGYIGG